MKIVIFGLPGSGKPSFANRLSQAIGIPVFHVDRHFFEKDWKERPKEAFESEVQEVLKRSSWMIEGSGMRTLGKRFSQADIVLYCKKSRVLCSWRLFTRWWKNRGIATILYLITTIFDAYESYYQNHLADLNQIMQD